MRLIGTEPNKFTRPNLHLKNIVTSFHRLSGDYMRLYTQHGLFICQQSRSVLRTLHVLCSFVAKAASRIFLDTIVVNDYRSHIIFSLGDNSQPMTALLKQLDSFALEKVNIFVNAKVRAVALLQIMDGILKTPVPTPRALTCPKAIPCASLRLVCDPDTHKSEHNLLEVRPGTPVVYLASGRIPPSLISSSQIPFNIIILWYTLYPKDASAKASVSYPNSQKNEGGPIAGSMSSSGTFFISIETRAFLNEGCYGLKFRLGCRDIRGGEWELPLNKNPGCFTVKVIPSRSK